MDLAVDIGSIAVDTFNGVKTLTSRASSGNYDSFQMPLNTFYQVPTGKIFHIGQLQFFSDNTNIVVRIGYADTSVDNSVSAPTNVVYLCDWLPINIAYEMEKLNRYYYIPSEKYPFIKSLTGDVGMDIRGIEI